jgi:hypothetical protein
VISKVDDPANYMEAAIEGLRRQTSVHASSWHFGREETWAADLDEGRVVFTFSDGTRAIAPIQVVGTYNTLDGTFLWGWDHPSVPDSLRDHAKLAQQWGTVNHVRDFTERSVTCSEDDAWRFAAVTNRLADATGIYRGPAGPALVFMTLGEIRLERPSVRP